MAGVSHVSLAVPEFACSIDDILGGAREWLAGADSESNLFDRFVSSSRIGNRHFVMPVPRILELGGQEQRAAVFHREGTKLASRAVLDALNSTGLSAQDIQTIIFTSCTAPLIPSLDVRLVNRLEFSPQTRRIPIYQHGCAGGAVGLALAQTYAEHGERVLVCSAELCSLVFQAENLSGGNLVGSAIFADGAACAIVEPSAAKLRYLASQSILIPETEHLMGYDLRDNGAHLRLDKELPSAVARCVREAVPAFLRDNGLNVEDVPWWLFHPGGAKILDILDEMFSLREEQSCFAREVLFRYGNMSSATVFFVLNELLSRDVAERGDNALMLGIGPGITVQLLLFEKV